MQRAARRPDESSVKRDQRQRHNKESEEEKQKRRRLYIIYNQTAIVKTWWLYGKSVNKEGKRKKKHITIVRVRERETERIGGGTSIDGEAVVFWRESFAASVHCLQTDWLATNCRAIWRPKDWAHFLFFFAFLANPFSHGLVGPLALFLDSIEAIAHVHKIGRKNADPAWWFFRPVVLQAKGHTFVIHFPGQDRFPTELNDLALVLRCL